MFSIVGESFLACGITALVPALPIPIAPLAPSARASAPRAFAVLTAVFLARLPPVDAPPVATPIAISGRSSIAPLTPKSISSSRLPPGREMP